MLCCVPISLAVIVLHVRIGCALVEVEVVRALTDRGVTRGRAEKAAILYKRRTGEQLKLSTLSGFLERLDALDLQPEKVKYLLTSYGVSGLEQVDPATHRWCTYKTHIWCSCGRAPKGVSLLIDTTKSLPAALAFDCEFSPLRLAMVDDEGRIRLDCLIKGSESKLGMNRIMGGVHGSDWPSIQQVDINQVQELFRRLVSAGTVLVGHAPGKDLRALRLEDLRHLVVDTSKCSEGSARFSLKNMAEGYLGEDIQDTKRHCSVEDALATMSIYKLLQQGIRRNVTRSPRKEVVEIVEKKKQKVERRGSV